MKPKRLIFRGHRNVAAIAVLNLLTGWLFIGWVVAIVWAFTSGAEKAKS